MPEFEQAQSATPSNLPTVQSIKSQMNLELMRNGYQRIVDEVSSLTYNEDNLLLIQDTIERLRKMKKVIESKHKAGKEEYLRICQMFDKARNEQIDTSSRSVPGSGSTAAARWGAASLTMLYAGSRSLRPSP